MPVHYVKLYVYMYMEFDIITHNSHLDQMDAFESAYFCVA